MNCHLSKLSGKTLPCDETNCGMWDKGRSQCGMMTYVNTYLNLSLLSLKLINLREDLEGEQ